jgi:hypothetical protein
VNGASGNNEDDQHHRRTLQQSVDHFRVHQ